MTESPWGKPYNEPFELDPPITAWRMDAIDEQGHTTYLRQIPNPGRWSRRAMCHQHWPYHTHGPKPGCSCGYRIVRDIPALAEYWRLRKHMAFDPRLTTPGSGIAIMQVTAAGLAQAHDQDGNMNNTNCLSVEFVSLAPGSTIYTLSPHLAEGLQQRYRVPVIALESDDIHDIPEAAA